jgi:hypothetical protein
MNRDSFFKTLEIKYKQFVSNYDFQLLLLASIFSGLLIIYIANKYFINTEIYFFLIFFGVFVSFLGFILEYLIKYFKRKSIERSFGYFLQDLAREYKNTNNISISLANISKSNVYGSIDYEIKKISDRVSWGDDFENALENINKNLNSSVISHTLLMFNTFKDTQIPLDRVLLNISKDITIFKDENIKKKYFNNLYYLAIILFFIFVCVFIFLNYIFGVNFLWYGNNNLVTRIFLDNVLLYIAILFAIFTSFILYSIKQKGNFSFLRYTLIFFIIVILLFQVIVPKPDAEIVLIDTINYMIENNLSEINVENIIAIKSISSKYIIDKTNIDNLYFLSSDNLECGLSCAEYVVFISDALFIDFSIKKIESGFLIKYNLK